MKNSLKYVRTGLIVMAVILVFILSFFIISSLTKEPAYAPDITGVTADGKSLYSLSENLGKNGTLLVFFDHDTDKAVTAMQLISQVAPEYDVDVMAVATGKGTVEEQIAILREKEITVFPHTLFDLKGEMAKTYNIGETPILYFIDKNGMITDAYIANITEKSLRKELKGIA